MPSYFGHDPGDDSDDDKLVRRDEYGDIFEDYGFVKRAEDFKNAGNAEFKKERFEKAIREYDNALDQLVTVAYDKSITIGKRKWNDIVICRATLHLNKSTCYFKLKNWQRALDEALECLVGNVRDEMMFTDPHVRNKLRQEEKATGSLSMLLVENRLPRPTRAKAWFRVSKCYSHLRYLDRAQEALEKALEVADSDEQLRSELAQHEVHIEALEREEKQRQKRQFRGFWDKLQDRGGYAEKKKPHQWDKLNYKDKYGHIEEEFGENFGVSPGDYFGAAGAFAADPDDILGDRGGGFLQQTPIRTADRITAPLVDEFGRPISLGFEPNMGDLPPPPKENVPPRPRRKEEIPLKWDTEKNPGAYARVRSASPRRGRSASPSLGARFDPAEAWSRRLDEGVQLEAEWRYQFEQQQIDEIEEGELRKARERMDFQKRERLNKQKKAWLEALDDSTDDERPRLK